MSSIRTLKPEFFQSESLARCSRDARLTFAGLWTEADSQGRGVANVKVLCGRLWPHDDDIAPNVVEKHLQELSAEHIVLYEVDGKRYYAVLNWENHQSESYRRGAPKYPAPDSVKFHDPSMKNSALRGSGREGNRREGIGSAASGTPTPEVFPITPALKEWATKNGCGHLDLENETLKFLDHHAAKGDRFKLWDRAWQKWMRQARDWSKGPTRPKSQPADSIPRQPPRPHMCDKCNEYHPPDEKCGKVRVVEIVDL